MIQWVISNWPMLMGVLSAIVVMDTALAELPMFKSNSTFQLIAGFLKKMKDLLPGSQPPAGA